MDLAIVAPKQTRAELPLIGSDPRVLACEYYEEKKTLLRLMYFGALFVTSVLYCIKST